MAEREPLCPQRSTNGSPHKGGGHVSSSPSRSPSPPPAAGGFEFLPEQGSDPTAVALEQCEKWVLRYYRFVLRLLGWTSIHKNGDSGFFQCLRGGLVVLWTVIILTVCVTQILCCFPRDKFNPGKLVTINHTINTSASLNAENSSQREITCSEHLISSFILSDLLLIITYLFGLYVFSRGETEYLSNLAGKVFVMRSEYKGSVNKKLIYTLLAYFVVGILWILLSLVVRIMTARVVRLFEPQTVVRWSSHIMFHDTGKVILILISLVGFVIFDIVYVAAVMNYAAQSELVIDLLRSLKGMIEENTYGSVRRGEMVGGDIQGQSAPSPPLERAVKDIMEARDYLRVLNGRIAAITAMILFNLGSFGVLALIALDEVSSVNAQFGTYFNEKLATVTAAFNVTLWLALVCFPFAQAARVNRACSKLKETGSVVRARPLQYSKTPQLELDSFVTFTHAVKLRATMFGIPMWPWLVFLILVLFTFGMFVAFQTGLYSFSHYL